MTELRVANTQVEDIWVSEPELRRRLGVSRSTVARWRQRGFPHVGHDRLRRYHLPTVLRWISENA